MTDIRCLLIWKAWQKEMTFWPKSSEVPIQYDFGLSHQFFIGLSQAMSYAISVVWHKIGLSCRYTKKNILANVGSYMELHSKYRSNCKKYELGHFGFRLTKCNNIMYLWDIQDGCHFQLTFGPIWGIHDLKLLFLNIFCIISLMIMYYWFR